MSVDQGVCAVTSDDDAREALLRAVDVALTTPVAARNKARKWSPRTCTEYLKAVHTAKEWWSAEQRGSRAAAEGAGLTGIPAADAAAFMPWDSDRLVRYVEHLANRGLAVATIRKSLTGLKAWHRLHGLPVPDGLPASEALQSHDTNLRAAGRPPKHAEPVSADTFLRLLSACARDEKLLRGRRDAALLCLAVAGMATPAALVGLNRRDVQLSELGLRVRPAAAGDVWVDVLHWQLGDEHAPALCPVECIAAWCGYLESRDVAGELPLLRGVDQHQNVAGLGAFAAARIDGFGRLDETSCGHVLRRVSAAAGVDPAPTMTELRIGGIVRRRSDGAGVEQLAAESGVSGLLRYVILAEAGG